MDGRDHDVSLEQVLHRCRQANWKLNKEKCLFRPICIPVFSEVISRHGMSSDPAKLKALTDMPPSKTKWELQSFLGIVNYLSKLSPMTAEVCKTCRMLTSVNAIWKWNRSYQEAKKKPGHWWKKTHAWTIMMSETIIPRNRCIKSKPRYCIAAGEG